MIRNRFKPIEIETDNPTNIFNDNKLEISTAIIHAIDFGLRNNKRKVDFAFVIIKGTLVITLSIDSREYGDLLEQNLETLIEFEAYEDCALAVKLQKKLNKKLKKNELQLQVQKSRSGKAD